MMHRNSSIDESTASPANSSTSYTGTSTSTNTTTTNVTAPSPTAAAPAAATSAVAAAAAAAATPTRPEHRRSTPLPATATGRTPFHYDDDVEVETKKPEAAVNKEPEKPTMDHAAPNPENPPRAFKLVKKPEANAVPPLPPPPPPPPQQPQPQPLTDEQRALQRLRAASTYANIQTSLQRLLNQRLTQELTQSILLKRFINKNYGTWNTIMAEYAFQQANRNQGPYQHVLQDIVADQVTDLLEFAADLSVVALEAANGAQSAAAPVGSATRTPYLPAQELAALPVKLRDAHQRLRQAAELELVYAKRKEENQVQQKQQEVRLPFVSPETNHAGYTLFLKEETHHDCGCLVSVPLADSTRSTSPIATCLSSLT